MNESADTLAWLDELNPPQRDAVTHGDGPLLVVAGAGSGKTRTLACRVAYLISQGVAPERILLLTFTRRAAEEMLKRAAGVMVRGAPVTGKVWGGTFHAIGSRLLRLYGKAAGLQDDFTVLDRSDSEDMINVIRHEMDLQSQDRRFPRKRTCMSIYSRCVNGADDLASVLKTQFPWCVEWEKELKALFKAYVEHKQERNVLDYDDLLLYWAQLVADPELAKVIGGRFDHVLVDEYQDTNRVQAAILKGMRIANSNIMVVGDDAQSIYSFRAATVKNMFEFPDQFEGTPVITLEQNYRSVAPILESTNLVIAGAKERYTKELWSDRAEGERPKLVLCKDEAQQDGFIIERVLEHYEQGVPLHQQAVLFRAAHLSDSLEVELSRRNIPYHKYGGLRFLEAAHVKDVIALLRLVENPRDDMAWFRSGQLMDGVGPATAARMVQHVAAHQYDPVSIASFKAPPAARAQMASFAALLEDLVRGGPLSPASEVERIRTFYDPLLEKLYENPAMRMRDVENVEQIAAGYRTRQAFLTDLQLDPPTSTSDLAGPPAKDEDWLVLSTIHSAKGCEWDAVYVIHAADGCLPSDMATGSPDEIEEERRLTYVAMTRARDFLYVTWPFRYYHTWSKFTDRYSYAQLCRFITDDVRATFDEIDCRQEGDPDDPNDIELTSNRDIAKNLRAMWD